MGDTGEKTLASKDDMDFFKTILKYMKRMKPIDNFEFRQALMEVIKRYIYKNLPDLSGVDENSYQVKREIGGPYQDYQESKETVLREINRNIYQRRAQSGSGIVSKHIPQVKQEVFNKESMNQRVLNKEIIKQEDNPNRIVNPLAAAFADTCLFPDSQKIYEISDSDSEVEELEIHIVKKKAKH